MDREAEFRRLYEAHRVAVHAYFTGRTGDRQSAVDLMQEVFLRAWQHLDKLTGLPEDGQRGWLFTVARNLSVDAARHQRTVGGAQRALERDLSSRPATADAPASTAVIAAERASVVAAAIAQLPEQQRVTIAMAAAGELNSAEIGAALGVRPAPSATGSRWPAARSPRRWATTMIRRRSNEPRRRPRGLGRHRPPPRRRRRRHLPADRRLAARTGAASPLDPTWWRNSPPGSPPGWSPAPRRSGSPPRRPGARAASRTR